MLTSASHQHAPQYRNRSFSTSQYQSTSSPHKIYYQYSTKKHHYDEYSSNKDIAYRNIPSFGDGPNCRGFIKNTHTVENNYYENVRNRSSSSFDYNQKNSIETHGNSRYGYDCRNEFKSLGRGSKVGLEKVTQQRQQNIDRINKKIKRILDTLNQEEKKMADNTNLKAHQHYRAYPQNNHRIKTEGNQNYAMYEVSRKYSQSKQKFACDQQVKKNSSENVSNIYGKLIGIREKYQTGFQAEERKMLGELTNKNIQRKFKTQTDYEPNLYSPAVAVQSPPKIKQNSYTPFKLLKGANVKSTDSLSMISSVYLNHEIFPEDRKAKVVVRQYDWQKRTEEVTNSKLHMDNRAKLYEGVQRENRMKVIERDQTQKAKNFKENYYSKKQANRNYKRELETQEDDQAFSSFGQSRNRAIEVTPQRKIERSISRYEKSEKSCKLSNGKDLDAEIEKIQRKMESFEEIKKQLKIEDSKNGLKSKQRLNESLRKYKQTRASKDKIQSTPKRSMIVNSPYEQIRKEFSVAKSKPSEFSYVSEELLQKQQNDKPLKALNPTDQQENFSISLPKPLVMSINRNSKRAINNANVKQIESAFISEDRFSKNNQAIESLILNLCSQIELDQKLRSSKKWFSRKICSSKWNQLNQELRKYGLHFNQNQLHQIFTLTEEEDNPFHTTRQEECMYKSLAEDYMKACQFWQENIHHKFIRRQIESSIKDMDIQKRSTVGLHDLVRYINLESDKYFRNRDLILIFKRFSSGRKEVGLEDVLGQFCQF